MMIEARRFGMAARPMAASVPTIADTTATQEPMIRLLAKDGQNWRVTAISCHQRNDRPSMGKFVSVREVKENTTSSTIGDSRKTTKAAATIAQKMLARVFMGGSSVRRAGGTARSPATATASMTKDMAEPSGQLNCAPNCGAMRLPIIVCLPPTSSGVT